MALAIIPLLVMLVGIILWAVPDEKHPRTREAGRILFAIGAAILTWMLRTHVVRFG